MNNLESVVLGDKVGVGVEIIWLLTGVLRPATKAREEDTVFSVADITIIFFDLLENF